MIRSRGQFMVHLLGPLLSSSPRRDRTWARRGDGVRGRARLAAVERYGVLDTWPEAFDRIAALAAATLRRPDRDHRFPSGTTRCSSNLITVSTWHRRRGAGMCPLRPWRPGSGVRSSTVSMSRCRSSSSDGYEIGMLCVIDRRPRRTRRSTAGAHLRALGGVDGRAGDASRRQRAR